MEKKFQTICKSELEDFETECQSSKVNSSEFILEEHDVTHTPRGNGLFNINGKVTITRNNVSKTYDTGNETHWVANFADDLKRNSFN